MQQLRCELTPPGGRVLLSTLLSKRKHFYSKATAALKAIRWKRQQSTLQSRVHKYLYWKNNEQDGAENRRRWLSVAPSLQDCPSDYSSLLVDGKIVILGIIQSFLYALV